MKTPLIGSLSLLVLLIGTLFSTSLPVSEADATESPDAPDAVGSRPIVVELFTSQGCSSCPPADELLSRLAEDRGSEIIPLAFHVDYWNYLGWRDPFSSAEWSQRQGQYAGTLAAGRRYTPQLVVDGREHCVGSDADQVDRLLRAARQRAESGRVDLTVKTADGHWRIEASADLVGKVDARSLDLVLAVVENDIVTPVRRGENARRTLHNDFIVRRLIRVASVNPGRKGATSHSLDVELDDAWQQENVRVVAFLQDPKSFNIYGADAWPVAGSRS